MEEARQWHSRALLVATGRTASGRLGAAEAEAGRAGTKLEEKARQAGDECQAWIGVARSHEADTDGVDGRPSNNLA